jgi:ribonuclease HI
MRHPGDFLIVQARGNPPMCGVVIVLYINHNPYIFIRYDPGAGSNNRVEYIALWTVVEVAKKKDVTKLRVMGDSKLVIDWEKGKNSTQDICLSPITRYIKLDFQSFKWLSFHHILQELNTNHILRELNTKADELSKEALSLLVGAFGYYEFLEREDMEAMELRL